MIKSMLENTGFKVTDAEFEEIMEAATADIKFNRLGFKKKTSLDGMLRIAERCCVLLMKIKEEDEYGLKCWNRKVS